MTEKRKVISAVFNAKSAQDLEKIRADIEKRWNIELNDSELIKFFIDFYLMTMDVDYYPVTQKKRPGRPRIKKKRGRPKA